MRLAKRTYSNPVALRALRFAPGIIGFNYYVTSERFLDHRVERYPGVPVGGNGREPYADVEAVRVCEELNAGVGALAMEGYSRFERTIAITEAQLCGSQEDQICWVEEMDEEATSLLAAGVDIRAFTLWSALGAYDWNTLVTQETMCYENGCFDVRTEPPRETLLAQWARVSGGAFGHLALQKAGWWRQDSRIAYASARREIIEDDVREVS